ncbi:Lipoprotein-anchoring transpeptidase ErfK/SrfK [Amycolatopsis pretoriensis]|uniref:Lipoprotein-anchoring transpeptidase ErfK/SrfK n=2 Tax=Amycolatopsis pretoriensis TaxID=218821 RepID=A0A1H5QS90_9PSEU|nr:L,D-transpeptidase [Amycolatopsis pretoriensis]SEF28980.1 Lipoprotein-anchoring transpeptidase ErfK/SrfK [Amycolatopsis pretoriensis]
MKRLLAGAAALATAFVLAACSGGGAATPNAGGGAVAAAGTGGGTPTTSSTTAAPTTTSATPTPSTTKPAPATTTSKPKPKPTPKPKPAAPASDPGVPCAAAAAASGTAACVDISAHKAWILQGGKVVYGPVPMLPGRKGYATPTGTFHVLSKEKVHLSKEFDNAPMPNSVFFYPGDAFHTGSLSVYSHGCIHLSASASLKFFNTLHIGDVVQVVP